MCMGGVLAQMLVTDCTGRCWPMLADADLWRYMCWPMLAVDCTCVGLYMQSMTIEVERKLADDDIGYCC